jgi:primosomal protein N' (replication factor Y)
MGGLRPAHEPFKLNEPQMEALAGLATSLGGFHPFLLFGVTGSGKTAVYLAAMQRALDKGMSSILLVPEIGLTPQTVGLLDQAFGDRVALLHSALTPEERSEQWRRIRRGDAPIVVGTRSAIFAPAPNLGLILVDEEHDQSYKQEETPRYNARDVAVMRAKLAGAVVVLGSATPSLESWQNSVQGKYARIVIKDRVMNRPLPGVELIDMRREFQETGKEQLFSRSLIEQTSAALERGEQALILLNRRGYSFAVICRACGEKLECENCAIALTHHKPNGEEEIAPASGWSATIAASSAWCLRAAPSARASTCTTWARARNRARSGSRRFFPWRASAAWIATPCADATTWNACWRACTPAKSTCWWARR